MKTPEEIKLDDRIQKRAQRKIIKSEGLKGINNIVPGNSLPSKLQIGVYALEKLAEYKVRTLNARTKNKPYVIHTYIGLYYTKRDNDYYEVDIWRGYNIKNDTIQEFNKKVRFSKRQRSVNPFVKRTASTYKYKKINSLLSKVYDEHIEMLKLKKFEMADKQEAIEEARELKEIKKQKRENKRNSKIVDTFHSKDVYNKNWTGITL